MSVFENPNISKTQKIKNIWISGNTQSNWKIKHISKIQNFLETQKYILKNELETYKNMKYLNIPNNTYSTT